MLPQSNVNLFKSKIPCKFLYSLQRLENVAYLTAT